MAVYCVAMAGVLDETYPQKYFDENNPTVDRRHRARLHGKGHDRSVLVVKEADLSRIEGLD